MTAITVQCQEKLEAALSNLADQGEIIIDVTEPTFFEIGGYVQVSFQQDGMELGVLRPAKNGDAAYLRAFPELTYHITRAQ
ncbi:hypothetical protein [Alkalihalobacillus sp. TS-13]|uniref:hypothetical protein n=1 Tax=Alkalihalobacillus sp. TS-13 TaxID=2842455 RepID=UPI001C889686|nr:hypothetical protein [Alkalihalobacillus sp. TS-13]